MWVFLYIHAHFMFLGWSYLFTLSLYLLTLFQVSSLHFIKSEISHCIAVIFLICSAALQLHQSVTVDMIYFLMTQRSILKNCILWGFNIFFNLGRFYFLIYFFFSFLYQGKCRISWGHTVLIQFLWVLSCLYIMAEFLLPPFLAIYTKPTLFLAFKARLQLKSLLSYT